MDAQSASYKEIVEEQMKLLGRKQALPTVEKVQQLLESERYRSSGLIAERNQKLEIHDPKGWKFDKKGDKKAGASA
jgi:hypothetical protein